MGQVDAKDQEILDRNDKHSKEHQLFLETEHFLTKEALEAMEENKKTRMPGAIVPRLR